MSKHGVHQKKHLFTRLFGPLDFFFPPHLFTAMGLSFFGRFLYWPVSRCALADCFYTGQSPDLKNPEKMVTPGGWGLAVGAGLPPEVGSWWGSCCQRWCADKSKSNREAAKACMAAWLSIALQREIKALVMERWRMAGACLALDCAKRGSLLRLQLRPELLPYGLHGFGEVYNQGGALQHGL